MNPDELRDKIRSNHKREQIDVEGFGSVWVRELPASALVKFTGDGTEPDESELVEKMIDVIIDGTVDEEGAPVFRDTEEYRATFRELTQDQLVGWFQPILALSGLAEKKG